MNKKPLFSFAVVLALNLLLASPAISQEKQSATPSKNFTNAIAYEVVRVGDGDIVVLLMDGRKTKVRLIGVDPPETVHPTKPVEAYGKEASQLTTNLLQGQSVYVEYEVGASKLDKYGRLLAYLYRASDGLFVNLEIIRQGFGHAYTRYLFKYMELFRSSEREAAIAQKGLWEPEKSRPVGTKSKREKRPPKPATPREEPATSQSVSEKQEITVYSTRAGKKYHRGSCRYLSKSKIPISLGDAKKRYGPCSVCRPPQ